jgi:arylsulfatase
VLNRSHSITADVEVPTTGAEGVLVCHGGVDGGYTFFVKGGKLQYAYNYVAEQYFRVASAQPVPAGHHQLRYEFQVAGQPDIMKGKGAPGTGRLYIDGKPVGEVQLPVTTPLSISLGGGVSCGANPGAPVVPDYEPPFAFTGTINSVTIDVSGDAITHPEGAMRAVMARQ